jgi:hypothetical protein
MEASRVIRSRAALGLGLLVCAGVAVPASAASAAYAPNLAIDFSPKTPGQPVAITSVLTQAPGETPSKTVKVSFPPGFLVNAGTKAKICTPSPDPEDPLRCPKDTQIGTAKATASSFGLTPELDGFVYFGGPVQGTVGALRLLILLQNPAFPDQRIDGIASLRPDGGYDNVFDNLPDILVTSFTLSLEGGDLALLKNPPKCGTYSMTGDYTSQTDEHSSQTVPFTVQCPAVSKRPRVAGLSLSRTGVASFTLSRAGKVHLNVSHGGLAVRQRTIQGKAGANRVRMTRLHPGWHYVVSAQAANILRRTRFTG